MDLPSLLPVTAAEEALVRGTGYSLMKSEELPHEGLHPTFKNVLDCGELRALAFSERLKSFRPKQTILEVEGEASRSKHLKGPSSQWVDVIKNKRAIHEGVINSVHQQQSSKPLEDEEVHKDIAGFLIRFLSRM